MSDFLYIKRERVLAVSRAMLLPHATEVGDLPLIFVEPVPYMDYEIFLGPIELYDWDGASTFDVAFAQSLRKQTC